MLVLSRKPQERLIVNDNIIITVVEIKGDRVRIGIEAPKDVSIHRSEVYDRIQQEETEHKTLWADLPYAPARV
jgi:carbon storage regulator